jgi:hypothetical protein
VEICPHPPVRQGAVSRDVEGGQPVRVGLRDDQGRVGSHEHPVREGDAIGYAASRAVGGGQRDDAGSELLAGHQVEAAAVDVGIAPTVHDELVPCRGIREASQVGVGHQRAVGLAAQEKPFARGDDEKATVG